MSKKTILIIIGIIAAVGGFLFFTQPTDTAVGTPSEHLYSQGSTGIVLTEYGDFQCPGCRSYYSIIKEVKELYKDTVSFQYRHLPLEEIHTNARSSARASEAAHLQGKFWEMHDMLFENQQAWQDTGDPLSIFKSYAESLGMDVAKFETDYRSSEVNRVINADLAEFKKTGATKSTPTFFLDGELLEEPVATVDYFKQLLDDAIAKKTGQQPASDQTVPAGSETPENPAAQ